MDANKEQKLKAFLAQIVSSDLQRSPEACWISSLPEQTQILQRLGDKEFWYWDQTKHKEKDIHTKGGCCFKHIVGLPRKTE
jgi:hypothetical protein